MRLALLRQGFFLVAASRGFDFAKPFLGVPEFERHGVAAARSNLRLFGEWQSRTRRLIVLSRGGWNPGRMGRRLERHRPDRFVGSGHRRRTAMSFRGLLLELLGGSRVRPAPTLASRLKRPVEPADVMRRLQSTGWDLGHAA